MNQQRDDDDRAAYRRELDEFGRLIDEQYADLQQTPVTVTRQRFAEPMDLNDAFKHLPRQRPDATDC